MKKKITEKTFFYTAALGSVIVTAILLINTLWASRQTVNATNEAVSAVSSFYLEAMADDLAHTITNLINNNFDEMEKAVDIIENEGIGSQEELRSTIGKIEYLLFLSRFALVDDDNVVYTQYTTYTGGSRHEFLSEEVIDGRTISTVYLYGSSKQLCLTIPVDFYAIGKHFRSCFVQIDVEDIVDLLIVDDEKRTFFGLYARNGENISDTDLGPSISKKNILEATKDLVSAKSWGKMCEDFAGEKEGNLTFTSHNTEETLCYFPVPETGWELVILISEGTIYDQIHGISEKNQAISRSQIMITLLSLLIFAVILLIQLSVISKEKLEAEMENSRNYQSMANTDSMTGVRNKHAYSDAEAALNEEIQKNNIEKLAVVVCDINGLKFVNDNKGHAAGDKLIKDASTIICEHFIHGAVYRTGGDEFAVLLRGKGYDTLETVIDELNRKMEENIKNDGVVISIGYSVLREDDEQLRDVFERADKMMYERKKELKSMGSETRGV